MTVLATLFVATLLVAQGCQQRQVRISSQQAVSTARRAVDFEPTRTQVRLVRQGLRSRPYWAVSLSVPAAGGGREAFERLATVRVDANTGALAAVTESPR